MLASFSSNCLRNCKLHISFSIVPFWCVGSPRLDETPNHAAAYGRNYRLEVEGWEEEAERPLSFSAPVDYRLHRPNPLILPFPILLLNSGSIDDVSPIILFLSWFLSLINAFFSASLPVSCYPTRLLRRERTHRMGRNTGDASTPI